MDPNNPGSPWPMAGALTGVCLLTLFGGGFFVYSKAKPEPVPAPKSYTAFKASDSSFRCVYPQGWKTRSGGQSGTRAFAEFRKGGAAIEVTADLQGSLMGDIAKSAGAGLESISGMPGMPKMEKQKPPVESLHEADKKLFERKYDGYEEQPMKTFQSGAGDARFSEFTAAGNFLTGKLHGFRATILGGERRISVKCIVPESDWGKVKPAFQKVIASVAAGGG